MKRQLLQALTEWLSAPGRKPLIIRGARQVGKTWLVREFAKLTGKHLVELNFEKQASLGSLFTSNDPKQILFNLSSVLNQTITANNSLLFLDEIQAAPEILSKLRWFAEDLPQLPVVCAGSLLEFVLADHSFSMPVGRISYMHLEPLSFEEFLLANDKQNLYDYIQQYELPMIIPLAIHEQIMQLFKEYVLVGGMPGVVVNWLKERSLAKANQVQHDLLASYRDDFAKYRGRIGFERLDEVMWSVPKMLGEKFVFSHVNPNIQAPTIKQILDLLAKARVCHFVWGSAANGVPLAAELTSKYFKSIFLDIGLASAALGLNLSRTITTDAIELINNGGIAEQVVGQMLRTIEPYYIEPALYCWRREEASSNAEIDYIIQHAGKIIPIEVKAGATGRLKSLQLFMKLKNLPRALRVNSEVPSRVQVSLNDHEGKSVQYELISLPFYLTGQIHRILDVNN